MNTKTGKIGIRLGALLLSLCLLVGLLPMTALAAEKRNTYNVYSDEVIAGGSDTQVYAVTIENVDGKDLHYVYSENAIHSNELMEQIRAGLAEPYESLIPTFEEGDSNRGFLRVIQDQEKYEAMTLDWSDPEAVADALIPGTGSVSVTSNDSAISVTDISDLHAGKEVVSKKQVAAEDFYTNPPELGQLRKGEDRVEAMTNVNYKVEKVEDKEYYDIFHYMHVTQISAFTATKEEEGTAKRNTYNVYAENVINGGSDSQVYAVTIENVDGEDLHYVYSGGIDSVIHSEDLMEKIRAGLDEPYKSLIPTTFEGDEPFGTGLLYFSRDQEKYEKMSVDWKNPESATNSLISGKGSVSVTSNDSAISVTDISDLHAGEKVVSHEQFASDDFYEHLSELGQLGKGENRVETITTVSIRTETVEGKAYYDVFQHMHVTQISAYTATKAASVSNSIDLPVRVLEEGDTDYSPAPELSASFTPDTEVTVGEFNQWQGLAIDYYNPMVDAELSEGYDIQAGYTVSIPLTDYEGKTLSGTLTIPLPEGYDGATARIKGGASASRYTAATVTFPLTLNVSDGTAAAFELLIEYKEAPTGGDDQTGGDTQTGGTTPQRPDRNGGGGSSSSYREREYNFWMDVRDEIRHADPGDTVKADARTYDRMPWSVMEALSEADGVTLHITWNGGEDIIIPSEAALSERNRVYYPLSYLEDMTFEVESEAPAADPDKVNPETGGILTETPELAEKGIEQPLPGVYEPEEATASPAEETGTNGLLIAGIVAVLAAAAGSGFWFWKRRKIG